MPILTMENYFKARKPTRAYTGRPPVQRLKVAAILVEAGPAGARIEDICKAAPAVTAGNVAKWLRDLCANGEFYRVSDRRTQGRFFAACVPLEIAQAAQAMDVADRKMRLAANRKMKDKRQYRKRAKQEKRAPRPVVLKAAKPKPAPIRHGAHISGIADESGAVKTVFPTPPNMGNRAFVDPASVPMFRYGAVMA